MKTKRILISLCMLFLLGSFSDQTDSVQRVKKENPPPVTSEIPEDSVSEKLLRYTQYRALLIEEMEKSKETSVAIKKVENSLKKQAKVISILEDKKAFKDEKVEVINRFPGPDALQVSDSLKLSLKNKAP